VISNAYEPELQRTLLEREGVLVDEKLQVDLKQFRWEV
jgi:alkylated DNA nucleotide flippase Atl1